MRLQGGQAHSALWAITIQRDPAPRRAPRDSIMRGVVTWTHSPSDTGTAPTPSGNLGGQELLNSVTASSSLTGICPPNVPTAAVIAPRHFYTPWPRLLMDPPPLGPAAAPGDATCTDRWVSRAGRQVPKPAHFLFCFASQCAAGWFVHHRGKAGRLALPGARWGGARIRDQLAARLMQDHNQHTLPGPETCPRGRVVRTALDSPRHRKVPSRATRRVRFKKTGLPFVEPRRASSGPAAGFEKARYVVSP
jgi:hypothetical protein